MVKALWSAGSRKEVMDLLRTAWPALDHAGRERLAAGIIAGPPAEMLERIDEAERARSRDRRIFERLVILERVGDPPLTAALQREGERLRALYPHWEVEEGDRAHFGSWMESRWGPDTRFSLEDLKALDDAALIDVLRSDQELREGLLEVWRQLALDDAHGR